MGSITKKYDPRKLPTIKKRALLLKEVTDGMDEYCDFYYIKSVFSSIMDMFLSCSKDEIIKTIDSEISEENFKKAAGNAYYAGRKNAVIIKVAKSGNTHKVYSFCHFCFFLKYKMRTLFMRVRD